MYFLYALHALLISISLAAAEPQQVAGIRLAFEPATLDWNQGDVPIHVINNVAEGLYFIDTQGRLTFDEAISMPKLRRGPDGNNIFKIRLRKDLKWSDGRKLTATDYIDSWRRLLDPRTGSTYAYLLFDLEGAREFNSGKAREWNGARAIGEHELELRLADPKAKQLRAAVFTHWATFPVRADLIASQPKGWGNRPSAMAFNGPYRIQAYQHGVKLELVPNPHHHTPGLLSKIEALIVQDDSTALRLYEAGRIHFMADLGTLDHALLRGRTDYHSTRSPVLVYLGLDPNAPLVREPARRRALSEAIDRNALKSVIGAGITPIEALTADLKPERVKSKSSNKSLLERFPQGSRFESGYFEKGANRLLMELLQNQWAARLGVKAELRASEVKSYWAQLAQKPYPVFLNTYGPPIWDKRYYFELLTSGNPMNMGRWSDQAYDQAVKKEDWKAAAEILARELPVIPLYFRAYEYLASPRLKAIELNPMTSLYLENARLTQ